MATYYVELNGGELSPKTTLKGGGLVPSVSFAGAVIYPSSGGGGANLETKSVSYTPSETAISDTLLPDPGYDGFDEVDVSVGAIPSNYVGSAIDRIGESDITVSGSSVTMPEGYYPNEMVASIPSAPLPTLSSATINSSGTLGVVANLSSDGYLPSGNLPMTLENAFAVQGAQTYTPGTTDQTISADQYLTGAQTILGDANLLPENIKKDVTIFGKVGTYEGGGGGGLPSEYQEVEYIGNDDTARIITEDYTSNITSTSDLVVECEMSLTETPSSTGMFVSMSSWAGCWFGSSTAGVITIGGNQNFTNITATARNAYFASFKNDYVIYVTAGGTTRTRNGDGPGAYAGELTFFGVHTSTSYICKARLYGHARVFKSVHNGDKYLLADFIPCYHKTTGTIGIYDLVGSTFYTAPSGTLEKGSDIISGDEALALLLGE